jgi:hypothetical protein
VDENDIRVDRSEGEQDFRPAFSCWLGVRWTLAREAPQRLKPRRNNTFNAALEALLHPNQSTNFTAKASLRLRFGRHLVD